MIQNPTITTNKTINYYRDVDVLPKESPPHEDELKSSFKGN